MINLTFFIGQPTTDRCVVKIHDWCTVSYVMQRIPRSGKPNLFIDMRISVDRRTVQVMTRYREFAQSGSL